MTSADIKFLTNSTITTLICVSNFFYYSDLLELPFASTLKKLSVSKNIRLFPADNNYEVLKMASLTEGFPALTHLKLKGFKAIKPEFLAMMPRLICFSVVDSLTSDITASQKYCSQNNIDFS